jgi:Spy/CpxP family protein refolding chaperone
MNGKSKAWAVALLLSVLILGGVIGAAMERFVSGRPTTEARQEHLRGERDRREAYLDWLAAELDLTDEQRAQVEAIVERQRAEMAKVWQELRPRFEELKSQARAETRALLNEEQLAAYEELLQREAERRPRGHEGR